MARGNFDPFGSMQNFQQMSQLFKRNPIEFLASKGIDLPPQYANNPDGAIQYLMDSGKMSQQQYNYVLKMGQTLGIIK